MNTPEQELFLHSPALGKLLFHKIYSSYVQPLLFTVKNDAGELFFGYSLGADQLNDRWLITPVSEKILSLIEQKQLPLVEVFNQDEKQPIFVIKQNVDNEDITELQTELKLLSFQLPRDSFFLTGAN
jgi:hypothetical protein